MKDGVILVNTSRGALVDTAALIDALRENKFRGVALDVYEEEDKYFFEDRSSDIIKDERTLSSLWRSLMYLLHHIRHSLQRNLLRLLQRQLAENLKAVEEGLPLENEVVSK